MVGGQGGVGRNGEGNGDWRPAIVAVGYGLTAMAVVVGIVAAWQW